MDPKTRRNFGILQSIHFSFFRQKVSFLSWKWPLIIIFKLYGPKNKAEFWDSSEYPLFIFPPKSLFFILKMATLSLKTNQHFQNSWNQKQGGILLKVSRLKFRICIIILSFFKFKTKTSFGIVRRIQLSFFDKKTPILLKVSRLK